MRFLFQDKEFMLQTMRERAKGPVLTIVVVAISLMFAASGVESILGSRDAQNVAKINGEKVSTQELQEAIFLKKRQLMSQMGENIDPAQLDDKKIEGPALDELIKRKLLLQVAEKNKMQIPDAEVNQSIAANPDFQQNGKFSQEVLQMTLARAGLTVALYKRLLATDDLLQQFVSGFVDTGFLTEKEIASNTKFTHQKRDIDFIEFSLAEAEKNISITPAEVKDYYNTHNADFKSEESADVEYIVLNQADFTPKVSDEEINTIYQEELKNFGAGEQRDVSHILIEVKDGVTKEAATEKLMALKKQITDGQDFAEVARQNSEDFGSKEAGGELGNLNEEIFPKTFVTAAKALKEGQVSDIVETPNGLHLIRVNSVVVLKAPSLADRSPSIKADLITAKAAPAYVQALEQLKDAAFNSADLKEPAETIHATVQVANAVTRTQTDGVFKNQKVRQTIFEDRILSGGENSDVIELSPTEAIVLRVKQHNESTVLPFEQVAVKAESLVKKAKASEFLNTEIQQAMTAIKAGESLAEVAQKQHLTVKSLKQSRRSALGADIEIIEAAFALPAATGTQFALDQIEKINGDKAVVVVSHVENGELTDLNPMESSALKRYVSKANAIGEFNAYQESLKEQADIDIFKK